MFGTSSDSYRPADETRDWYSVSRSCTSAGDNGNVEDDDVADAEGPDTESEDGLVEAAFDGMDDEAEEACVE